VPLAVTEPRPKAHGPQVRFGQMQLAAPTARCMAAQRLATILSKVPVLDRPLHKDPARSITIRVIDGGPAHLLRCA
jgi:hypothetical protein